MKTLEQIAGLTLREAGEGIRESYIGLRMAPPEWDASRYLTWAARRVVWYRASVKGLGQ